MRPECGAHRLPPGRVPGAEQTLPGHAGAKAERSRGNGGAQPGRRRCHASTHYTSSAGREAEERWRLRTFRVESADVPEEPTPAPLGALRGQSYWRPLCGDARASRSGLLTLAARSGVCLASRIGKGPVLRALKILKQSWVQAPAEGAAEGWQLYPRSMECSSWNKREVTTSL